MSLLEKLKKQQSTLSKPITQVLAVSRQKVPQKYKRPATIPKTKAHLESREITESNIRKIVEEILEEDSKVKDDAQQHYIEKKSQIEPNVEVLEQQWIDLGDDGQRIYIMQMLNDKAKSAEEKYFFAKLSQLPVGMQNEFFTEYLQQRERYSKYYELWTSRTDVKRKIQKSEKEETVEAGAPPRVEAIRRDIMERAKKYAEEHGVELPEREGSYEEILFAIEPSKKKRKGVHIDIVGPYLELAEELGIEDAMYKSIGDLAFSIARAEKRKRNEPILAAEHQKELLVKVRPTTISTHKKLEIGKLESDKLEKKYRKMRKERQDEIEPEKYIDEMTHFYPAHKELKSDKERERKIQELAALEKRKIGYYRAFSDLQIDYALLRAQSKQRKIERTTVDKILNRKVDNATIDVVTSFLSSALLELAPSVKEYEKDSPFIIDAINSLWGEDHSEITNMQLFEKIAHFLAFLHMKQAKILRARISEKYYLPQMLLNLSPKELLPEVYETKMNSDNIDVFTNYLLTLTHFYVRELARSLIQYKDPTRRSQLKHDLAPSEPILKYDTNTCVNKDELGEIAPENMAFYRDPEDGNVYCLNTLVLAANFDGHDYTNPYTGRKFDKNFIRTYVISYYDASTGKVYRFPQSELYKMFKNGKYKHPTLDHPFESDFIQKVLSGSPLMQAKEHVGSGFFSKLDARLSVCENGADIIDEPPQNVVIYRDPEDKKKYCFAIDKLAESIAEQSQAFSSLANSSRIINPKTGRYFSEKFIKEFVQKYGLYQRPVLEKAKEEKKEEEKKEAFLIPNLYDIIKGSIDLINPVRQENVKEKGAEYIIGDVVKIPDDDREYTVIDINFDGTEIMYTIRYEKDAYIVSKKEYKKIVAAFEEDEKYEIKGQEVEIRDGKFYLGKAEILPSNSAYTPGTIVIRISEAELLGQKEISDENEEEEKLPDYKKVKSILAELAGKEEKSKAKMGFATKEGSTSSSSSSKNSSNEGEESESVSSSSISSEKTEKEEKEEKKDEVPKTESGDSVGMKCEKCGKPCSDAIKSVILEENNKPKIIYFCTLSDFEKFSFPSTKRSRRKRGRKRSSK